MDNRKKVSKPVYIIITATVALLLIAAIVVLSKLSPEASGTVTVISEDGTETQVEAVYAPVIDEILAYNISYPNADGKCTDFIELYNPYSFSLDLSGWGLSDSRKLVKYSFSQDTVLEPGEYMAVWCSTEEQGDYAPFGIASGNAETIFLTDSTGIIVSEVNVISTAKDKPMVLTASGEWEAGTYATPGFANTDEGYARWDASVPAGNLRVRFNEILCSNSLYRNSDGKTCDYIELRNYSSSKVSLTGASVCDEDGRELYTFPTGAEIEPEGYYVLWCSADIKSNVYSGFAISSVKEETFLLRSSSGRIIDTVISTPCEDNCGWGLNTDGNWQSFDFATPGAENTEESYEAYLAERGWDECPVLITELMPVNNSTLADSKGRFSDWIELYNDSEAAFNLEGWYLTDSEDSFKWCFPELTIAAGERAVLFCSGDNAVYDDEIHTSFSLSSAGETVRICSPMGETFSSVSYQSASADRAVCQDATGETYETMYSTPGYTNNTEGYTQFCASRVASGPLAISEIMTSNTSYIRYGYRTYVDWMEIQNISDEPVNLSGYSISDSLKEEKRCALPDEILEPGEYYIIYLAGDEDLPDAKYFTANFSLNSMEDSVYIFDASGSAVDYTLVYQVPRNCSFGRANDGAGFVYFVTPTPGEANSAGSCFVTQEPTVTVAGGIYNDIESLDVGLTGTGDIYYTTDGSVPTEKSKLYTEPIHITETTVIRAVCVNEGLMDSDVMTESYFINENHTLPIVSLVSPYNGLFSSATGIYVKGSHTNYYQDWEREANVTLYEQDGKAFGIDCGLKMFGAGSREYCSKKSFKLLFKNRYEGALNYDVFGDGEVTTFSSLVLRGGEDYRFALIRDDLCGILAKQTGDNLMVQNTRFCILYIDGEYWGIYSIKEQFSQEYYASHMNVSPESVTVQSAPMTSGTFLKLLNEFRSLDMSKDSNFEYVCSKVDIYSLIDWAIMQAWSGNNDISVNVRYIQSTEGDGLWRWCYFDQDWALYQRATYKEVFESGMQYSSLIIRLFKNATFKKMFCERLAELCRTVLATENVNAVMNNLIAQIEPEMERERARWGLSMGTWRYQLEVIDVYINRYDRVDDLIDKIVSYLGLSTAEKQEYFGDLLE